MFLKNLQLQKKKFGWEFVLGTVLLVYLKIFF